MDCIDRLLSQCLLLSCVVAFSTACGPESPGSGASSPKPVPASAPQEPALALRSEYYSAEVEAELKAAGLSATDFKQGQRFYELYCTNCHAAPQTAAAPAPANLLGPPSYAVAASYRQAFPSARERSAAIAQFTAKPTEEAARMPWAVERFGLMSPMPLSEKQLQQIGTFLATAEFEKPGWYAEPEE